MIAAKKPKPSRLAKEVVAGRELVVLLDGPWAHRWYWADDLAGMQHAAERYPVEHPAGELRGYVRTRQQVPHPTEGKDGLTGTAFRYAPGQLNPAVVPAPRVGDDQLSEVWS